MNKIIFFLMWYSYISALQDLSRILLYFSHKIKTFVLCKKTGEKLPLPCLITEIL